MIPHGSFDCFSLIISDGELFGHLSLFGEIST